MIEIITIFIPVAIICRDLSVKNCEMIQYQGYFHSEQECRNIIDTTFMSKLLSKDHAHIYIDTRCVSTEIRAVDKKYLPQSI